MSFPVLAQDELCSHNLSALSAQTAQIGNAIRLAVSIDRESTNNSGLLFDPFFNREGCFAPKRAQADECTHSDWSRMGMLDRAEYVRATYEALLDVHGLDYSPRILTCKAVRESCLRPQDESPSSDSTASGLSQVTLSTAKDLFRRGNWFQSKVLGFDDVTDGATYHSRMSKSVVAQLELGLAVLHQKSIDHRTTRIRKLLEGYYGLNPKANKDYSDRIYDCAACIEANDNRMTTTCLKKARNSCFTE
jgi:hypothetical protein